jgi:hypothetical protein
MKKLHIIPIIALMSFVCSCATVMPANTPNVPLLEKKGDAKMSGSLMVSEGGGLGINAQIASSPVDKFYWGASASLIGYGDGMNTSMFELGVGTYRRLGRSFRLDLSGGGAVGSNNTWGEYSNQRLFAQSAIAYTSKRIQLALGAKFNQTYFNTKDKVESGEPDNFHIQTLDPFFVVRTGGSNVKFQLIGTYSTLTGVDDLVIPDPTISLGIYFNIGKKVKN